MFDITSSKLLILAIVALLVVGPKDLPLLLRTVGKYLGLIRRHAAEFRAQLDEALREAELDQLKKDFESVGQEMRSTLDEGGRAIDTSMQAARIDVDDALKEKYKASPAAPDSVEPQAEAASAARAPEKTGTDA
jgi:sec-independent protein translocase protein TatB